MLRAKVYRIYIAPTQDLLLQNLVQQCFLGFSRRILVRRSPESDFHRLPVLSPRQWVLNVCIKYYACL